MNQVECLGGHSQDVSWMDVWEKMATASCVIFLIALFLWGVELLQNHTLESLLFNRSVMSPWTAASQASLFFSIS